MKLGQHCSCPTPPAHPKPKALQGGIVCGPSDLCLSFFFLISVYLEPSSAQVLAHPSRAGEGAGWLKKFLPLLHPQCPQPHSCLKHTGRQDLICLSLVHCAYNTLGTCLQSEGCLGISRGGEQVAVSAAWHVGRGPSSAWLTDWTQPGQHQRHTHVRVAMVTFVS